MVGEQGVSLPGIYSTNSPSIKKVKWVVWGESVQEISFEEWTTEQNGISYQWRMHIEF